MKKLLLGLLFALQIAGCAQAQTIWPDVGGINVPGGISTTTLSASGKVPAGAGMPQRLSTANVNDTTPTASEIQTALPSASAGELGIIDDAGAGLRSFLTWTTDGTARFFKAGTLGTDNIACEATGSGSCYFIDPVAGNDSNSGTENSPWKTFANVSTYYSAGYRPASWVGLVADDVLYLRGGTYDQAIAIGDDGGASGGASYIAYFRNPDGTAGHPITIKNYPGETPIIDGTNTVVAMYLLQDSYYDLIGIEAKRGLDSTIKIAECDHVNLTDIVVHDTDGVQNNNLQGLHLLSSGPMEIVNLTAYDNYDRDAASTENSSQVAVFSSVGNIHFDGGNIYQTVAYTATYAGAGLKVKHASTDPAVTIEVENIKFTGLTHYAFGSGNANTYFHNNIIDGGYGIMIKDFGGVTHQVGHDYSYNTLYNVLLPIYWSQAIDTYTNGSFPLEPTDMAFYRNLVWEKSETQGNEVATFNLAPYMDDTMYAKAEAALDSHDNAYSNNDITPKFNIGAANGGAYGSLGGQYTLAGFQALGANFEANSVICNPNFTDAAGDDFTQTSCAGYGAL